jgi:hypothetical protein
MSFGSQSNTLAGVKIRAKGLRTSDRVESRSRHSLIQFPIRPSSSYPCLSSVTDIRRVPFRVVTVANIGGAFASHQLVQCHDYVKTFGGQVIS